MPQRHRFDGRMLSLIKLSKIEVDSERGFVYGSSRNIDGVRRRIGFLDKNGDHLFSHKWNGKCFTYYVCRAVWISAKGTIDDNMVVAHKNKNKNDNRLCNLALIEYQGKQFTPHPWSQDEMKWLCENFKTKSLSELSKECGRSIKAVRHKIKSVGIPQKRGRNKNWTSSEEELLIKLYKEKKSIQEISDTIGRSQNSVRLHAGKLNMFRSDRHLQDHFRSSDFYNSLKRTLAKKTSRSECCLCGYNKYIELHHLDGDNQNHHISNIASLCGNCHNEVEHGEHQNRMLYCIWWRVYSDGASSPRMDNKIHLKGWQ